MEKNIEMHNIIATNIEEMVNVQGRTHYQLAMDAGKDSAAELIEGNIHNTDKSRSPMQWNENSFAGFSTQKSWIKANVDYTTVNVAALSQIKNSILNTYKQLIALKNKEKTLQYGKYENLVFNDDQISFTRSFAADKITVIINLGNEKKIMLPAMAKILMGNTVLKPTKFIIYRN